MKLALLLFILLPLISFAQTETELIAEFNVNEGKLNIVVPQVLDDLGLTYVIESVNLSKRKVIEQHTFINTSIQEILDYLAEDTKIVLEFDEKRQTVHLYDRKPESHITITGIVQSTESSGGIVDVHVSSMGNVYQTITDQNGFYSLRVPKDLDSLNLTFSHIQFVTTSGWVVLANAIKREKVVYNKFLRLASVEMPLYRVKEEVQKVPVFPFFSTNSIEQVFFGKSLNHESFIYLSGADQYFRMEGGISYKGSPSSMNQFLLDGERINDPFKLKGEIPIVEDDVTKAVKIYEGVAPARYVGGSVVVDILAEDGNVSERQGNVMISDQYASFTLTGPIESNTSSYFLNFRSNLNLSQFDTIVNLSRFFNSAFSIPTDFSEIRGKLSAYINRDNIISFSGFYGSEVIKGYLDPSHISSAKQPDDLSLEGIKNKEVSFIAKWDNRSITNAKINVSAVYKHSNKELAFREGKAPSRLFAPKGIQDMLIFNGTFEMGLMNNLSLVLGFKNDLVNYSYSREDISSSFNRFEEDRYSNLFRALDGKMVNRLAGFVELNRSFDKMSFSVGVRLTDFSNISGFNSVEPRLIFKYRPNPEQSNLFEINYGRNVISEYSIFNDAVESFVEYPFFVTALSSDSLRIEPYVSNELNVNYKVLVRNKLFIELGHFVKTTDNLLTEQVGISEHLIPALLSNYTMLGISFKGALQLNNNWNFSAMITYKDFINFNDSISALDFSYKYGFVVRKRFNKKLQAEFNYLNYKEAYTSDQIGRISVSELKADWKVSKSFSLGIGYRFSNSDLLEHNAYYGDIDLRAVLKF